MSFETDTERAKRLFPIHEQQIPGKIRKLMKTGRWEWIEKTDGQSRLWKVGVRRKSNGEERFW